MITKKIASQAFNHKVLDKVILDLTLILLSNTFKSLRVKDIDDEELKKSVWLASILSDSTNQDHKKKAQLFTSLLFLNNKDRIDILKICYILFSRIGNLTATKFLDNLYLTQEDNPAELESKYHFGDIITRELISQRESKIIQAQDKTYLITDFQKELWNALKIVNEIAISAPTSSGKSFIIKKFITDELSKGDIAKVLYIVPSRALINQVSEDFLSELNSDIHLKNTFVEENELYDKEIYVLTPERCIKLLTSDLIIDFIFIDEIQGIEDISGRGQTFEYVFSELSAKYPAARIVTAGPNISNPDITFSEIFERKNRAVLSRLSPVFQIKFTLRKLENSTFEIKVQNDKTKFQTFQHDFGVQFTKLKTLGDQIAYMVHHIAPHDFNIVYVSDSDQAQKWCRKYAAIAQIPQQLDNEIMELIDFLKEDIHSQYFLIDCLKKGVAYHHGSLPDIVRKEIEVLYVNEKIKTLFCTSTLLEGVNLPANNLFTLEPKKDKIPLTKFEFGNLIGRAGRLNSSLYGSVYYLERRDDKKNASEYLEADYGKELEIFSSNAFTEFDPNDLKNTVKEIKRDNKTKTNKAQQFSVFIKLKYLKDRSLVEEFLNRKRFPAVDIQRVINILDQSLSNIEIPYSVLRKNPTVDPHLQNELYKDIKADNSKWLIDKNKKLYPELVEIMSNLNSIFDLKKEAFEKHNRWFTPRSACVNAVRWVSSLPLGQIIQEEIDYKCSEKIRLEYRRNKDNLVHVNTIINETIKYNSSITTHLLPKYLKIMVDILEFILSKEEQDRNKITMSLPTFLELGTQEQTVIQLISAGVTRSVAIQINRVYKKNTTKDYREKNDIWVWLRGRTEIKELKPIYNRYLKRLKILA